MRISKQDNPLNWNEWDEELARELEKPIARSMFIGASTAQEEIPGKLVDWTLQHPQAQKFIREHALELAKRINDTTKKRITDALLTGMRLGEGRDLLAKRVKAVMAEASDWRAKMIAQTETITSYANGSLQLYKEGGIKQKEWLAGAGACEECSALDGTVVGIDEEFDGGEFGKVQSPSLHPNCRCSIRGVVE